MCSLLYRPSGFISAVGSIPPRGVFDNYVVILDAIFTGGYLGPADGERSDVMDQANDTRMGYRVHQEILIGDPFVDAL
jgi:hypothetical protein